MDETPQDAWFYAREGEKIGPVTLADLRVKAAEGELHPRQDMVWRAGMETWKPAGEIDGLFERKAPEVREALAPPADPYRAPSMESVEETMLREGEWPGARRRSYLIAVLMFPLLWQLILTFAAPVFATQFGAEITGVIVLGGSFVPLVVSIWFGLSRLANLGMSRWWFLGNLVPILNFWVGYRCFACPSGYAYHKKLDGAGIFLAIVYWMILAIALLAVAAMVAVMLGAIGDPDIQEQIREAIREAQHRVDR
jgi:GYF domain 2